MDQSTRRLAASTDKAITFGPFCLFPGRHLLCNDDKPVAIGSRALDILIALTERPGELVTKDELVSRAWPNATVEESNLRAQVALVRKALGDDHGAPRYVTAVPARGYRFIAPISHSSVETETDATVFTSNLPRQLMRPIGREEAIKLLASRFQRYRLVTVVGPGGMGKTTMCLHVAEQLLAPSDHGVCFVDLAPVSNAELLTSAVASALLLSQTGLDPTKGVVTHLRDKRVLLVLDSCEVVLEAVASLAETLLREAPGVRILATSREALRVEGESVYRLPPLETPPANACLTAEEAVAFPAVRLFVDRATALGGYTFTDDEAPLVTHICRQLDGIALAIELAAGRVEAFGTRGIADLLNDRLKLLTGGRRTALPRHQTLVATIDWSYEALSGEEREVFRRAAIFTGDFSLDATEVVATGSGDSAGDAAGHLANLVAKSLVVADANGKVARYRLLDTTRAYAIEKLRGHGEFDSSIRRLASYLCKILDGSRSEAENLPGEEWLARYGRHINDVRTVLEWAYSVAGDAEVGLVVTVAAIPLWYQLSLVDECLTSVNRALLSLDPGERRDARTRQAMQLYRALGLSQAFKIGFGPQAPVAFSKALEMAEELGDADGRSEALWGLWLSQVGLGQYRPSLETAQRFMTFANTALDRFIGERMLSWTLFCMGDFRGARHHAELMLSHDTSSIDGTTTNSVRFRFGQSVSARVQPGQLLWMQGFADQALRAVESAVEAARGSGHAISLCEALARWACPVYVLVGDLAAADAAITDLLDVAAENALGPWAVFGRCWKAALLISQGHTDRGIPLLRNGLAELRQSKLFAHYNVRFRGFLAEGLERAGEIAEAKVLVDAAIDESESKEELWCIAELFRVKGEILRRGGAGSTDVEACFNQSIEVARRQDALALELRAVMDLAQLLRERGERQRAHRALASVYERFTEGFDTADMKDARNLLTDLSDPAA